MAGVAVITTDVPAAKEPLVVVQAVSQAIPEGLLVIVPAAASDLVMLCPTREVIVNACETLAVGMPVSVTGYSKAGAAGGAAGAADDPGG